MIHVHDTAAGAWLDTLATILSRGRRVAPRGLETLELTHHALAFRMRAPVVNVAARRPSYKFMAAEALWILSGDDTVDGIAPYNAAIAAFSDDGKTFYGAYGPRVTTQLPHVINALCADRDTRQAVLTTWRPSPPPTKDVPCTVALTFEIRDDALSCHAFMRSSDAWLGLPYDVFNFSLIAARVACAVNLKSAQRVKLGNLYLTAVSSHLYARDHDIARLCLGAAIVEQSYALAALVDAGDWDAIAEDVRRCRDNEPPIYWRIRS